MACAEECDHRGGMAENRRPIDQVLAVVRHPSFCSELAPGLVAGLAWAELMDVWDLSSVILQGDVSPRARLAHAALRDALLDEMETQHPVGYAAWVPARSGG